MKKAGYLFYALVILFVASCGAAVVVPIALFSSGGSDRLDNNAPIPSSTSQNAKNVESTALHLSGGSLSKPIRNVHLSGADTYLHISGTVLPSMIQGIHLSGNEMDKHISGVNSQPYFQSIHLSGNAPDLHVSGSVQMQAIVRGIHVSGKTTSLENMVSIPNVLAPPAETLEAVPAHLSGSVLTQPVRDLRLSGAETILHISGFPLITPVPEIHISGTGPDLHLSGVSSLPPFKEIHLSGNDVEIHVSGATLLPVTPSVHFSGSVVTF